MSGLFAHATAGHARIFRRRAASHGAARLAPHHVAPPTDDDDEQRRFAGCCPPRGSLPAAAVCSRQGARSVLVVRPRWITPTRTHRDVPSQHCRQNVARCAAIQNLHIVSQCRLEVTVLITVHVPRPSNPPEALSTCPCIIPCVISPSRTPCINDQKHPTPHIPRSTFPLRGAS